MRTITFWIAVGVLAGGGCSKNGTPPAEETTGEPAPTVAPPAAPEESPPPSARPGRGQGPPAGRGPGTGACPMQIEGTEVAYEEIEGGGVFVFTAAGGQVEDLRAHVAEMATIHNGRHGVEAMRPRAGRGHGPGPGAGRGGGRGPGGADGAGPPPISQATAHETEDGARLEIVARSEEDVEALRAHMKDRSERMQQRGDCPFLADDTE